MYFNRFGTKWYQNRQSLLNSFFIMPCESRHAHTCHNCLEQSAAQRHLSSNADFFGTASKLFRIISFLTVFDF